MCVHIRDLGVCVQVHVCVSVHEYMSVQCTHVCIFLKVCMCLWNVCIWLCARVCEYMHICVNVHMCVFSRKISGGPGQFIGCFHVTALIAFG